MRVYKFLCARWAIENLEKRRIKASDADTLNDPFDFLAVDLTDAQYRKQVLDRVHYVLSQKVLCCFSSEATNPLLWAHYSDFHKGICLGFEITENVVKNLKAIHYIDQRLTPDEVQTNAHVVELLFKKFSAWSYEKEVRAFLPRDPSAPSGELTFVPFDSDLQLKEIILGCKCKTKAIDVTSRLIDYPTKVIVLRAYPSLKGFEMCFQTEYD